MSDSKSVPASKKPKTTNPVIETVIQEEATQPPFEDTNFELTAVSPQYPHIQPHSSSPTDFDYANYEREVSVTVFQAENQIGGSKLIINKQFNLIGAISFHFFMS